MLQSLRAARAAAPSLMLEACAESAGRALACPFSSSAEFEAALIAERRAEGRYRPRRHRRRLIATSFTAALAVGVLILLFG